MLFIHKIGEIFWQLIEEQATQRLTMLCDCVRLWEYSFGIRDFFKEKYYALLSIKIMHGSFIYFEILLCDRFFRNTVVFNIRAFLEENLWYLSDTF